jgi:hypothetical protein
MVPGVGALDVSTGQTKQDLMLDKGNIQNCSVNQCVKNLEKTMSRGTVLAHFLPQDARTGASRLEGLTTSTISEHICEPFPIRC